VDVDLKRLEGALGRMSGQRASIATSRDTTVRAQQQQREQCALLRRAEPQ
jgi:hypothetical protein